MRVLAVDGELLLLAAADDDVPCDEEGGAGEPEGREGFGEDDEAEDGGQHEVCGGVEDGDLGGGGGAGEGFGEEGPHLCSY